MPPFMLYPEGKQRSVFVYGTLAALPLLTQFLTANANDIHKVARLAHVATVIGYRRVGIKATEHAAVIEDPGSVVRGLAVLSDSVDHRVQIDDNHSYWKPHNMYRIVRVRAYLNFEPDVLDVDMFLWNGPLEDLTMKPWDLKNYMNTGMLVQIYFLKMVHDEEESSPTPPPSVAPPP